MGPQRNTAPEAKIVVAESFSAEALSLSANGDGVTKNEQQKEQKEEKGTPLSP